METLHIKFVYWTSLMSIKSWFAIMASWQNLYTFVNATLIYIYIYIYTYTIFSVVRYAIRIILCTKSFFVRVYRKYSWIVWYISAYRMNCIVLVNRTIHGHVGLKWVFLLKFVVLFDLNKLLEFVNTKLLGNLIESNEIASPWVFFLPSLSPTKFKLYS